MAAGVLQLEMTQGEDWTVQIQSLDDQDNPKPLVSPARMDIVNRMGSIVHSLVSITEGDDPSAIPGVAISTEVGLIQLHIPRSVSVNLDPGSYVYDLWVTIDDGSYAGAQAAQELKGNFIVNDRVTKDF